MLADELDNLFGALNGKDTESAIRKEHMNINEGIAAISNNDSIDHNEEEGEEADRTTSTTANNNDGIHYDNNDSILNSNNNKRKAPLVTTKAEEEGAVSTSNESRTSSSSNNDNNDREIATGTAHDKSIRSYSAYPPNYSPALTDQGTSTTTTPAKVYPYALDPFQTTSIDFIERNESVLVAAHTSAGKTTIAEYAIAKCLREGQRAIYTSPIKALSNQKYRDLQEEFTDVGLMTGDITLNPTAQILVMTTEILRSMLYRGSELMREVAWVIYDEIHYMRDKERGVVWEESIILLPHRVRFVFLSATIPNSQQFVNWICKIHHQPCHVVYTNYRPVPLQHYVFPHGGDGLYLVVDEKGKFREANFQRAMAILQQKTDNNNENMLDSNHAHNKKQKQTKGDSKKSSPTTNLFRIVKLIMTRSLNPVIIFSFSKKDCEKYALSLGKESYNDSTEQDLISQVYQNALEGLSEDDRKLPQVEALLPLLKRGIGVHHGGLLTILKEIVEILFGEGLIKVLFATETFAIGINMPAKTVVFTNTRKWDGKDFRWITSGEYIQMSGRAGRRGKDDRGIVIQMMEDSVDPSITKDILYGAPDSLNSSYHIKYNMLLNMLRVEDVDPEYLLRASFHQFQQEDEAPALEQQALELEAQAQAIDISILAENMDLLEDYYEMTKQLELTQERIMKIVRRPQHILPFLAPGRLLYISIDGITYGWGALASRTRSKPISGGDGGVASPPLDTISEHVLVVLLPCCANVPNERQEKDGDDVEDKIRQALQWKGSNTTCRPVNTKLDSEENIEMRLFTVGLENVLKISAVRVLIPPDVHSAEARLSVRRSIKEVQKRFTPDLPLLDNEKDMGVKGEEYDKLSARLIPLMERLSQHKLKDLIVAEEDRSAVLEAYSKRKIVLEQARVIRQEAKSCQTLVMKDQLKMMKKVLRQLGHVDANGVIQTKGRTACEINTADELVVVEMMFSGAFNDISVEQCVALLSCMTYDEVNKKGDESSSELKSFLQSPFLKLQEAARTVARAQIACKLEVDEDQFVDKYNPGMMEAVFAWCKGAKFADVQKLTTTYEGTTIRTLRRLEELLRQLAVASKAVGNHELEAKFEKGSELIKRDIVFCSSLYL